MISIATRLLLGAGLLLAAGPALAQAPADTAKIRPLARNLFGTMYGLGVSTVSPDDDYYLPNDGIKFGSEVAFTYTRFFSKHEPTFGLRTGIGFVGRSGRYSFFGQDVRRAESFLTVPLEVVTRHRWQSHPRIYSTGSIGGYFSELASRYTYTLDPGTGKTQRSSASWLYATGGFTVSTGIGYQHQRYGYRELGLRISSDAFTPKSPDAGQLPNLRQGNITLYYSGSIGF
jgi:hypothetical protein